MKKNIYIFIVVITVMCLFPSSASAASVYLESSKARISVGDTVVVTVKIDAEGTTLNTIEGNIVLKSSTDSFSVKEFSLANSAFGLWPRTPSLSSDGKVISFVGGVPGGFNIEGATLFKIILQTKAEGDVTISPQDVAAFLNDGKGTKLVAKGKDIVVQIGSKVAGVSAKDDWSEIVSSDTISPEDFIIVLGQDKTLFDGKKFAFFSSVDNQSGISHYDVSEDGAPAVRSGSTYVLQDQTTKDLSLNVVAYDKAGNKKIARYTPGSILANIPWPIVGASILALILIYVIYRKFKK